MFIKPAEEPGLVDAFYDTEQLGLLSVVRQIMLGGSGVALLVIVGLLFRSNPHIFELHVTPMVVLGVLSVICVALALALVSRVRRHSTMLTWLTLVLLSLLVWDGGQVMVWASSTPEAVHFWAPFSTLGAVFIPSSMYMFALSYTSSRYARQPLTFLMLIGTSLLLVLADMRGHLVNLYELPDLVQTRWGYATTTGRGYIIFVIWFIALGTAALLQLYRYWRTVVEPETRRQAMLICASMAVPLLIGGFTDGIAPSLGITDMPQLGALLTAVTGVAISYGILRYHFFRFSPDAIAPHILSLMDDAVLGLSSTFQITYVNNGAERLLHAPAQKLLGAYIGTYFKDYVPPERLRHDIRQRLREEVFAVYEAVRLKPTGGGASTVKMSVRRMIDDGQPYGYVVVMTDITAMAQTQLLIGRQVAAQTREIRKAQGKLAGSINSLELGFLITDNRPELTLVNNVAHRLFCDARSHDATHCATLTLSKIQQDYIVGVPLVKVVTECLQSGKPRSVKAASFNHRTWRIFITPIIDGKHTEGVAIVIQDITEEQILARSRDEFFSIASHELRTPLTVIKGNTSLMMQYYPEAFTDPAVHQMIQDIHDSSNRLIGIVNDFLDVSRIEQGRVKYELQSLSVAATIEEVIYEMGASAREKGIKIQLSANLHSHHALPLVHADANRVKQVIYNLLSNALKHTTTGKITIGAEVSQRYVKIIVEDSGEGIPLDMQPLLFHKFQQAGESLLTRDATKGTGLGLYISRLLVRGMGGVLRLERSAPGAGAIFSFTLPVAKQQGSKTSKAAQAIPEKRLDT